MHSEPEAKDLGLKLRTRLKPAGETGKASDRADNCTICEGATLEDVRAEPPWVFVI